VRRNLLILGLVLAVIGIVLCLYVEDAASNWGAWYRAPMLFEYQKEPTEILDIRVDMYAYLDLNLKRGTRVEYSFSANNTVHFLVMDRRNYEQWKAGESFDAIHEDLTINSAQFVLVASRTDKFYFVIDPVGEYTVRVSVNRVISYMGPPSAFVAVGLIGVGAIVGLLGFRLKPRIPAGLLDLVKTRGRVKIAALAWDLHTTEAHVEIGVQELIRAGHPIRFEAETREVVYVNPQINRFVGNGRETDGACR